jgi:hypothetical protein
LPIAGWESAAPDGAGYDVLLSLLEGHGLTINGIYYPLTVITTSPLFNSLVSMGLIETCAEHTVAPEQMGLSEQ